MDRPLRVVVASDKFKGTLTSAEVARHVSCGIRAARPEAQVEWVPVADGGDGSLDVAITAGARYIDVATVDAHGHRLIAPVAIDGATATIEVARICGLGSLEPDGAASMTASSVGIGHAIRAALDQGATRVILAVGGTSTTDGGAGMLRALGAGLLTELGQEVGPGGGGLAALSHVDLTGLDPRLASAQIVVASDVDNPLLGADGAAAVYGPQKGAGSGEVDALDRLLNKWARLACLGAGIPERAQELATRPGAGAGGGLGFGVLAVGGTIVSGADLFLDMVGLEARLKRADLVVTGEGRLDTQSLRGKAPVRVALRAHSLGVPATAVVGACLLDPPTWRNVGFDAVETLVDLDPRCAQDPELAGRLLVSIGRRVGARSSPRPFPEDETTPATQARRQATPHSAEYEICREVRG